MKAIEFFSGIGAFAYAARETGIEVVAAFDQGEDANRTYEHNFGAKPRNRNLDSIKADEIPDADIWWLSPPCTPYTVRGLQRDDEDPRAKSFANLIELLADKLPQIVFVENVVAFESSQMCERLLSRLRELGYEYSVEHLCSSDFGVPMKRPRIFVVAQRSGRVSSLLRARPLAPADHAAIPLAMFVDADHSYAPITVAPSTVAQYEDGMNIVDPSDPAAYAICFTSGYGTSYTSSGSFLKFGDVVRRFAPSEILGLLGFGPEFEFPDSLDYKAQWRLAGNSVDVRCIRHLLRSLEEKRHGVKEDHDPSTNRR